MKKLPRLLFISCALLTLYTACNPTVKVPAMTAEENRQIQALTEKMTPRCVGRYLIDLPQAFVLNSQSMTEIENVKITVKPTSKWQFDKDFANREALLIAANKQDNKMYPILKKVQRLPEISDGGVFYISETGKADFNRTLELLSWKNGYSIYIPIEATDGTDMKFDESVIGTAFETSMRRMFNDYKSKNNTPEKLAHLLKVYERTSGRRDDEVPQEKGVCFANGFYRGEPSDREVILMHHHLENSPDVAVMFHSLGDLKQSDNLLERGKSIEAKLKETLGHTIRKGKSAAQIEGAQEWLMTRKSAYSELFFQHFTLEANSKTGSAMTPVVIVDLDAGTRIPAPAPDLEEIATRQPLQKTTFSEAQSVALWDKMAPTLRPRPGAF